MRNVAQVQSAGESPRWLPADQRAREMRESVSPEEFALWRELRGKNLGAKFRRKHVVLRFFDRRTGSVGGYICDLYCPSAKLAVEVDESPIVPGSLRRDAVLSRHGIRLLRFTRAEISSDRAGVLHKIKQALAS
jgi:cyclase